MLAPARDDERVMIRPWIVTVEIQLLTSPTLAGWRR